MKKLGSILLESLIAMVVVVLALVAVLGVYQKIFQSQTSSIYRVKTGEIAQSIANVIEDKGYAFLETKAGSNGFNKTYTLSSTWGVENGFHTDFATGDSAFSLKNAGVAPSKLNIQVVFAKSVPYLSNGDILYSDNDAEQNMINGTVTITWQDKEALNSKAFVLPFVIPEDERGSGLTIK